MRHTLVHSFAAADLATIKQKILHWLHPQQPCCFYLDSNRQQHDRYGTYECLAAAGAAAFIQPAMGYAFRHLDEFRRSYANDWLFGYLSYDLKNEIEPSLYSHNKDLIAAPPLYFCRPETVIFIPRESCELHIACLRHAPEAVLEQILRQKINVTASDFDVVSHTSSLSDEEEHTAFPLKAAMSQTVYLKRAEQVLNDIRAGLVYELNLCQAFESEGKAINTLEVFQSLNKRAQAPFSAYMHLGDMYLLCASPERFLKKAGDVLISQPIKGTIRRGSTPQEDEQLKQALQNNPKERSENIMIVDLVRNDLTPFAKIGSIAVEELCEVYSFATVHQLISTVKAVLKEPQRDAVAALKSAFPMGSMTGCPKIKAMEQIEQYETRRRGLFSGAVGYFAPNGDFDFNVVIRSILYRGQGAKVSVQAGSALTIESQPLAEYQECLLKAEALQGAVNRGD